MSGTRIHDVAETIAFAERRLRNGTPLQYKLSVLQQPMIARACGMGAKSHADRRPVDPPPVVELKIFAGEEKTDVTFSHNSNFFLFATLEQARPIAQGRGMPAPAPQPVLTGVPVSGMAYLDRPTPAGYFIFPDLSVRHEGKYRLRFALYEESKDREEIVPAKEGEPTEFCKFRVEVKSRPFTVFSAKRFPGLKESTALSRIVAEQGCRVRIRRDVRMRRRTDRHGGRDEMEMDETAMLRSRGRAETPDYDSMRGQDQPQQPHHPPLHPMQRSDSVSRKRSDSDASISSMPDIAAPRYEERYAPRPEHNSYAPPPLPPPQPAPNHHSHLAFGAGPVPHHPPPPPNVHPPQMSNVHPPQMTNVHPPQMSNVHPPQMSNAHTPQMLNVHPPQISNVHPPQMPNMHPQMSNVHPPQMSNVHPQIPNVHPPQMYTQQVSRGYSTGPPMSTQQTPPPLPPPQPQPLPTHQYGPPQVYHRETINGHGMHHMRRDSGSQDYNQVPPHLRRESDAPYTAQPGPHYRPTTPSLNSQGVQYQHNQYEPQYHAPMSQSQYQAAPAPQNQYQAAPAPQNQYQAAPAPQYQPQAALPPLKLPPLAMEPSPWGRNSVSSPSANGSTSTALPSPSTYGPPPVQQYAQQPPVYRNYAALPTPSAPVPAQPAPAPAAVQASVPIPPSAPQAPYISPAAPPPPLPLPARQSATPPQESRGTKRAFGNVFNDSHITEPLRGGSRPDTTSPNSTYGQEPASFEEDDEFDLGKLKMRYRRADGEEIVRRLPIDE